MLQFAHVRTAMLHSQYQPANLIACSRGYSQSNFDLFHRFNITALDGWCEGLYTAAFVRTTMAASTEKHDVMNAQEP